MYWTRQVLTSFRRGVNSRPILLSLQFSGMRKGVNPEEKYSHQEQKLSSLDRVVLLTGQKRPVLFSEITEFLQKRRPRGDVDRTLGEQDGMQFY